MRLLNRKGLRRTPFGITNLPVLTRREEEYKKKYTRERQSWMMVGGLSIIIAIGLTFSSLSNWYIVATIGLLAFSIYKYAETGIPGSWPWILRARREYFK